MFMVAEGDESLLVARVALKILLHLNLGYRYSYVRTAITCFQSAEFSKSKGLELLTLPFLGHTNPSASDPCNVAALPNGQTTVEYGA